MRIGEFNDEINPEEIHYIDTDDLPLIPIPTGSIKIIHSKNDDQKYISVDYKITYYPGSNKIILSGKSSRPDHEHSWEINPETFARGIHKHLFSTNMPMSQHSIRDIGPAREAIDSINEAIALKAFKEESKVSDGIRYSGKGFLISGGDKVACFESLEFSDEWNECELTLYDVYSRVNLAEVDLTGSILYLYAHGRVIKVAFEQTGDEKEFYLYTEKYKVSVSDITVEETGNPHEYFEAIGGSEELIESRLSLLDNLIDKDEDPFDRFLDIL